MSPFQQVIEFNATVLGIEQRPLTYPQGPEIDHVIKCYHEEVVELSDAFQQGDFIGCIDANMDLIYFAIGSLYKMGLNADQMERIFTTIHNKNMTKTAGKKESRATDGADDAVKGEGWVGPEEEIAAILDQVPVAKFTSDLGEGSAVSNEKLPPDNPENDPEVQRALAAKKAEQEQQP